MNFSSCTGQKNSEPKDVQFQNGEVLLAGELVLPEGNGPFPAVVFLHGSGPHTREGFRSYASKFADMGIASIFYDKRGTGSSTGSWITGSLEDLADDAVQAVKFLEKDKRIDTNQIGLWGISQAGWIAPMVAHKTKSIAFAILISGGGASPKESEIFTYQNILDKAEVTKSDKISAMELVDDYFLYLETGKDYQALNDKINHSKDKGWYQYIQLDRILPDEQNRMNWEWVATYNPKSDINEIDFPLLLMFGGQDKSHPTELSVTKWKEFLKPSIQKKMDIKVFPEAGHGIRMRNLEGRPFADGYMDTMVAWLNSNVLNN